MNYKAIIFDLSDTLIEYTPNYETIYGDRLRDVGLDVPESACKTIAKEINWAISKQVHLEEQGQPRLSKKELENLLDKVALAHVLHDKSIEKDYLIEMGKREVPRQQISVIDGVIEMLDYLNKKFRLAVVSNHYSWMGEKLDKLGVATYFESIIISETVGVSKPNPKIMEYALKELQLKPEECLYVGDQPIDVQCAKLAGMSSVWINSENHKLPDYVEYLEDFRIANIKDMMNLV